MQPKITNLARWASQRRRILCHRDRHINRGKPGGEQQEKDLSSPRMTRSAVDVVVEPQRHHRVTNGDYFKTYKWKLAPRITDPVTSGK